MDGEVCLIQVALARLASNGGGLMRYRRYLFITSTMILVSFLVARQMGWVTVPAGDITGVITDAKSAREHDRILAMPVCEDAADFKAIQHFDVLRAYPRRAINRGIEGRVKAMLRVDDAGTVRDVMILSNIPAGQFDTAVEHEALKMKYEPAEQACRGKIRERDLWVDFKLED